MKEYNNFNTEYKLNEVRDFLKFTIEEKEKNKKKRKKKRKLRNTLLIIILIIAIGTFSYSSYKIINWQQDNKKTKKVIESIEEKPVEVVDNENTETVAPPVDEFDPYWDYIKIPLIDVDFYELLKENPDTVGWINVGGTNINYPVVQASNNDYYLNHSFDESWNDAGWVFMDYRNDSINFDNNTIIYGHSRLDKSMFGSLRNITTNSWYKDTDNYIMKFSTPTENTLWQIFSVYTIKAEGYYLTTDFDSDSEYQTWLNTMLKRSVFNFNTSVNTDNKVLTLSSCYTSDGIRVVLHAKLIKIEKKV